MSTLTSSSSDSAHEHHKSHHHSKKRKHHSKRHHKPDHCDPKCKTTCDAQVEVAVKAEPRVHCTQSAARNCNFDLAMDLTTKPHCRIRHLGNKKLGTCKERCVFRVDLDIDYQCRAEVLNCPKECKATFDLDAIVPIKQKCKKVNTGC